MLTAMKLLIKLLCST